MATPPRSRFIRQGRHLWLEEAKPRGGSIGRIESRGTLTRSVPLSPRCVPLGPRGEASGVAVEVLNIPLGPIFLLNIVQFRGLVIQGSLARAISRKRVLVGVFLHLRRKGAFVEVACGHGGAAPCSPDE